MIDMNNTIVLVVPMGQQPCTHGNINKIIIVFKAQKHLNYQIPRSTLLSICDLMAQTLLARIIAALNLHSNNSLELIQHEASYP